MPRSLTFIHDGSDSIELVLKRVSRSQLYGSVDVLTQNADDELCSLATLAIDGKTLIPRGGSAMGYVNSEGSWVVRSELQPVDRDGNALETVASSFDSPIELDRIIDEDAFLDHSVRLTYLLQSDGELPAALTKKLQSGAIFQFDFSYRGGVDYDPAFMMLCEAGHIWMLVGSSNKIEYVGLEQAALCGNSIELDGQDDEDESDEIEFGML